MYFVVSKCSPVRPVEKKEVAIAGNLRQQLALFALELSIENDWGLASIVIVGIVRSYLVSPHQLSGIRVQGNDGSRVKAISFRRRVRRTVHGNPVAGSQIVEV